MNCAEVNQKIELFVLGGLSKSEHVAIKAHLAICPACNAAEAEYRSLVTEIKQAAQPQPLRLDFVRAVRLAVKAEIRTIALRSLARRIIAITASVAACLLFGLVIWHVWIFDFQSSFGNRKLVVSLSKPSAIYAPAILQAWQHRGARSVPGSMADEIVVHQRYMYLLQESGGSTYVASLDLKTGKQKWLSDIQMDSTSSPQGCGYLLADDSRVYCLAEDEAGKFYPPDGRRVYLVALDAANGKTLWKYPQQASSIVNPFDFAQDRRPSSIGRLTRDESRGTRDDSPCRPTLLPTGRICWTTDTTVHMLNCADGKLLWTRSISDGGLLSAAAVVDDSLYVANEGGLYCLNIPTGDETWRLEFGGVISSIDRPLLVAADGEIYAALNLGFGSRLLCIALKEHKIIWQKDIAHITHLYASGDILYLRDQDVQALDRTTGQLLWTFPATGCNPLTYTEELAYFVDSSDQGRLIALDRYTGNKVWQLEGMKSCNAFIKVDSTGFLKTHDGVVYAIIFKG